MSNTDAPLNNLLEMRGALMLRRLICVICVLCMTMAVSAASDPLERFGVRTVTFTADRDYANPFGDVEVVAEVTRPDGTKQTLDAFWDGGRTWRVRVRCEQKGAYRVAARTADGASWGERKFSVSDHPAPPRTRLSEDRTHFVGPDGQPWFFLADTAWNGALRSTDEDWNTYLKTRKKQRFNTVQFVTTQWRGGRKTLEMQAFEGTKNITISPVFFQRMDRKFAAVVEHGLMPAPVMLWALQKDDPGQALDEADAARLARYELARWGALDVIWLLGGDGRYEGQVDRWKRIGQATFADHPEQIVTLHPCGQSWIGEKFADQPWYDFVGYQSGHGGSDNHLKFITQKIVDRWDKVNRPVINLEPNYEAHPSYESGKQHPPLNVRRASYWSLLVAPAAGITYGNNAIWTWNDKTGTSEGHERLGPTEPWRHGLDMPAVGNMTILREFFESGPWAKLRPAPGVLTGQPGDKDPKKFIAAAQTEDGSWTVVYTPIKQAIELSQTPAGEAQWFDPRTGKRSAAKAEGRTFTPPDDNDWVLEFRK
jgi:hypothetical protein